MYFVHFHIEWKGNVMPNYFEMLMAQQVIDIAMRAGEEVVGTENDCAMAEQALAKVRAEESGTASNQYPFFEVHLISSAALKEFKSRRFNSFLVDCKNMSFCNPNSTGLYQLN